MTNNQDLHELIKLTEPNLALENNLRFTSTQAEYIGKGIMKLRARIAELANELNRTLSVEGQLQEYLQDLILLQDLIRRLAPIRNINAVMALVLESSADIFRSRECGIYLWGEQPLKWQRKKAQGMSAERIAAIERELSCRSILDGTEIGPMVIPFFTVDHKEEGSLILAPLVSGDRQSGVFISYVATSHLNYFGHHLNIFAMFGNAVTIALENAFLFEKVKRLSIRDDLTELYNARFLRAYLANTLVAAGPDRPVALFFMDLDNFKSVNDSYGHLAGSAVLTEAAQLIQNFAGEKNIACRYGGDEFVLALPDTDTAKALARAEELRFIIEVNDFYRDHGMRLNLTMSIGVALYPHHAENAEEMLNYADLAMYTSKTEGKNRVTLWRAGGGT